MSVVAVASRTLFSGHVVDVLGLAGGVEVERVDLGGEDRPDAVTRDDCRSIAGRSPAVTSDRRFRWYRWRSSPSPESGRYPVFQTVMEELTSEAPA